MATGARPCIWLILPVALVASLGQESGSCALARPLAGQCRDAGNGRESETGWLSLLQKQAAVVEKMHNSRAAFEKLNKPAAPTLAGECADLDDVTEQISAVNDTAAAAADAADVVNSSAADLLGDVTSALDAASSVLQGIQAAVKMVAVLNGGAATLKLVDSFVELLSTSLTKVQTDLQDVVAAANEQIAGVLEQLNGVRDEALGEFAEAVAQVTALCDVEEGVSLAEIQAEVAPKRGPTSWFRKLFQGTRGDDFDKAEAAIATANDTAATMASILDDLNATATGALTDVLDSANSSLTALKEEVLPEALASFDGKIPAPVMSIVKKQATAAVDKAFEAVSVLVTAVPDATAAVLAPIEVARGQLAAVFAASDGLVAITEDARAKAE